MLDILRILLLIITGIHVWLRFTKQYNLNYGVKWKVVVKVERKREL